MASPIQNLHNEHITFLLYSEAPKAPEIRPLDTPVPRIPLLYLDSNSKIGQSEFLPIKNFFSVVEDDSERRSPSATSQNRLIPISRKENTPPPKQAIQFVPVDSSSKKQPTLRLEPEKLSDGSIGHWEQKFGSGLAVAAFAPSSFNDREICRMEEQAPFTLTRCARALVQVLRLKKRPKPRSYFVLEGEAKLQEVVPVAVGSETNIIKGFAPRQTSKSPVFRPDSLGQSLIGKPGPGRLFIINEEFSESNSGSNSGSDSESGAEYPDFRINGRIGL
jgi:hypothetical protein